MSERVDKGWMGKGLQHYSDEAIVGTLGHYGLKVDAAAFRAMADGGASPVRIAAQWLEGWKGTGQFARFPVAAAEVLWRRWLPERATPGEFLEKLSGLLVQLERLLGGKGAQAALDAAFGEVDAVVGRVPQKDGARDQAFFEESFAFVPKQQLEAFDALGETLAKRGHGDVARRFTALEEALLPDRAGIASAVVRAALGEKTEAVDALKELTSPKHATDRRLFAVDALIHLGELAPAREGGEALLDESEKARDWHRAMDVAARLEHVYKQQNDRTAHEGLLARARTIEVEHAKDHPNHGRGHRH
jgi:hypothetical protein